MKAAGIVLDDEEPEPQDEEPERFEFGGGGLKPSATASERAARSLSGMAPKVAAQVGTHKHCPPRLPTSTHI